MTPLGVEVFLCNHHTMGGAGRGEGGMGSGDCLRENDSERWKRDSERGRGVMHVCVGVSEGLCVYMCVCVRVFL